MPKVSIILPVYNVEPYVSRCVSSVLGQTFKDFELIVVDDACEDNSVNIFLEGVRSFPSLNWKLIHHGQNQGLSAARNSGLEAASGQYVYFLDSDDFIEPDLLEVAFFEAQKNGADVVMFGSRNIYESGTGANFEDLPAFAGGMSGEAALLSLLRGECRAYFCMQLFRRELFDAIRFPLGKVYEDRLTLPYIYLEATKVVFVQKVLYNYTQREGSITRSFRPEMVENIESVRSMTKEIEERIKSKEGRIAANRFECNNLLSIVQLSILRCDSWKGARAILDICRRNINFGSLYQCMKIDPRTVIHLISFYLSPSVYFMILRRHLKFQESK